jgi:cysteinyl-tRNA synthetase
MLRLYNTLSRTVQPVEPLRSGRVSMYCCGPTVYRYAHVGNMRTYILSDLIRRVLEYHGIQVEQIMNITDVGHMTDELRDEGEDKMLLGAEVEGKTTDEIAAFYTDCFMKDVERLNIRPATTYPRASDHISQIQHLVQKLIERGHAYEEHGTVYYDVSTFPAYGRLSGQSLDDMRAGHRIANEDHHKRHHQDFILWKAAGPRRVLVYDSPWGTGYPGWHIECSAMSMHYLGSRFDIHTGGEDNRFPHHEDEIAQSEGATGAPVVSTWVHGHHLLMGQAKMAKSAGNVLTIQDVVEAGHDPLAFRYLCFTARYRRQTGLTEEALSAAGTALRRLRERVSQLGELPAAGEPTDAALRAAVSDPAAIAHQDRFVAALDDDLDFPAALKVLGEALADERVSRSDRRGLALSWDAVLGLDLGAQVEVPPDIELLVSERDEARAAKQFARADELRDRLRAKGFDVIDTAQGPRVTRGS